MTNSTSVATRATAHAYPPDLARLVAERWAEVELSAQAEAARAARATSGAPSPQALERLLSVCYQASLLYEESRPVTFRLACAEPEKFSVVEGPPAGLHRLMFERTRPFDEHELSRLAPAAVFERSLIGVHLEDGDELRVWDSFIRARAGCRPFGEGATSCSRFPRS